MEVRIAPIVRSAAGVLALFAAITVALQLAFGGPPHHSGTRSDESRVLREAKAPPLRQRAAATCFRTAVGVVAVRSRGDEVLVTFGGTHRPMEIVFRRTDDAAIRYAYAHGPSTTYLRNTNWFDTPTTLTEAGTRALSRCLPG